MGLVRRGLLRQVMPGQRLLGKQTVQLAEALEQLLPFARKDWIQLTQLSSTKTVCLNGATVRDHEEIALRSQAVTATTLCRSRACVMVFPKRIVPGGPSFGLSLKLGLAVCLVSLGLSCNPSVCRLSSSSTPNSHQNRSGFDRLRV